MFPLGSDEAAKGRTGSDLFDLFHMQLCTERAEAVRRLAKRTEEDRCRKESQTRDKDIHMSASTNDKCTSEEEEAAKDSSGENEAKGEEEEEEENGEDEEKEEHPKHASPKKAAAPAKRVSTISLFFLCLLKLFLENSSDERHPDTCHLQGPM